MRAKSPWPLAIVLAVAASASGILLTGLSAWFLGAVALAGLGPAALAFNFHTPAAFVRLFALSKTLGKYGERVVGHRAALLDQIKRRARLFLAMAGAPATRAAGWQLGNQDRLSDYMEDVEDVDYAALARRDAGGSSPGGSDPARRGHGMADTTGSRANHTVVGRGDGDAATPDSQN